MSALLATCSLNLLTVQQIEMYLKTNISKFFCTFGYFFGAILDGKEVTRVGYSGGTI